MTFWWHLTFPDENGIAQYGLCLIIIEAFTSYALDKSQTLEKCMSCRTNQNVRHYLKLWGRAIRNKNTVQSHINRVTIQFISHLNQYFNFSASFLFFLLRVSSSSILDLSDFGYEIWHYHCGFVNTNQLTDLHSVGLEMLQNLSTLCFTSHTQRKVKNIKKLLATM